MQFPAITPPLPPRPLPGEPPLYCRRTLQLPTPWRTPAITELSVVFEQRPENLCAAFIPPTQTGSANVLFTQHAEQAFDLGAPVVLEPVRIAKPWGAEIWFSAIEARGESTVHQGAATAPLSHYLAVLWAGQAGPPILLKRLAPAAARNTGDLYLETHDEKHEVYVVTAIDSAAWPSGRGAIRYGVSQTRRAAFADDKAFRQAFLDAVLAYRQVRDVLDAPQETPDGTAPHTTEAFKAAEAAEPSAREAMYAFTELRELAVGDVIEVLPGLAHSLQHGVEVFEFQTPTYERNIISFGQRVITQPHWDSEYAVQTMRLDPPVANTVARLPTPHGVVAERIVAFAEFNVLRVTLEPDATWPLPAADYHLLAAVEATTTLRWQSGAQDITDPQATAVFVPPSATRAQLHNSGSTPCIALLAMPTGASAATMGAESADAADAPHTGDAP